MKTWYLSKTIWVAILTIIVGVLTQLGDLPIPDSWKNGIITVVGIINFILRLFTTAVPINRGQAK